MTYASSRQLTEVFRRTQPTVSLQLQPAAMTIASVNRSRTSICDMIYPTPENEEQRLKSLDAYNVVGTPPEFDFDEIAREAAKIFDCPVGVINVVAEKWEWYKGKYGIPEDVNCEPRGGICSTTVCVSDLLLVPDLLHDERFCDQDMVVGDPHFRFYAGIPLVNPEGYALGSLCVLDYQARQANSDQIDALRFLTKQVVSQLELRRKVAELDEIREALAQEKQRSDELLLNTLPPGIADELKQYGSVKPRYFDLATILFSDFKGFTGITERSEPRAIIDELNEHFSAFDDISHRQGLEKLKTIGDAYMCAGGVPDSNSTHPVDCCVAALEMRDYMAAANTHRASMGLPQWEIRIGIHTGPVIAGVIGKRKFTYDIWGDAVNVASLMETLDEPGQITISESTHQKVNDHFDTVYRGEISTAKKGNLKTYFLVSEKSRAAPE